MPFRYKGQIQQHNDRSYKSLDNQVNEVIPNTSLIFPLSPCIVSENDTYIREWHVCRDQCNQGKPIIVYHMLSVPLTSSLSDYISGSFQAFCLFPVPVYPDPCTDREGWELHTCKKAYIWYKCVRGTPDTRFS